MDDETIIEVSKEDLKKHLNKMWDEGWNQCLRHLRLLDLISAKTLVDNYREIKQ